MALTKVSTGLISADLASVDLNIDANTFYIDVTNNRVGINNTGPATALDVTGTVTADGLDVSSVTGTSTITPTELTISTTSAGSNFATGSSNEWGILGFYKSDTSGGGAGKVATIGASMVNAIGGYGSLHFKLENTSNSYALEEWLTLQNSASAASRQVNVLADGGLYVENNVGIGTTSPATVTEIVDANPILQIRDSNTSAGSASTTIRMGESGSGGVIENYWDIKVDGSNNGRLEFIDNWSAGGGTGTRMVIDDSGNVGIGTDSPDAKIETSSSATGNAVGILLTNTNGSGTADSVSVNFGLGRSADSFIRSVPAIKLLKEQQWTGTASTVDASLVFSTVANETTSEAMRIDSSGKVGLNGNTNPTGELHIGSGSGASVSGSADDLVLDQSGNAGLTISTGASAVASIFFADPSSVSAGYVQYTHSNNALAFATQATEAMRIDASGNVSVTSAGGLVENATGVFMLPTGELRVKDNTEDGTSQISIYNNNVTNDTEQFFVAMNLGNVEMGNRRSGYLSFKTVDQERMRIDSSGNLLVGTTDSSPYTTIEGFVVALNNGTKTAACFGADNVASRTVVNIVNPNGQVGSITTNASATAFNTSSDQRLKENIVDAPSASDDIDAIQVRSFDWKADGSHQKYGMIAQELITVAPEAVSASEDPEEMMGVDYSKLVPMMLKEIQSLRARVAQLEGVN